MKLDQSLYDCDDCFSEALMDIGEYLRSPNISLEKLEKFNSCYKQEYQIAHIDRNLPVRK